MSAAPHPTVDVTIVTPAFRRARLIGRALDSVRLQTRRPARIIVIDDASQDGTADAARRWAEEHDFPVTVEVLAENGGPAVARNRGIELATTEYVAFLDSDDEHTPQTLERLVAPLEAKPEAVLSFADATVVSPAGREPHALFRPRIRLESAAEPLAPPCGVYRLSDPTSTLLKASIIPTSATCFRRAAALAAGGMPAEFRSGEDWLFWLRLAQHGDFVFQLDDLAMHHRHDANLTSADSAEFVSREKLRGFLALARGTAGVALTPAQRERLSRMLERQLASWRYHRSRLGLRAYLDGLHSDTGRALGTPLAHYLADPRSLLRATYHSLH